MTKAGNDELKRQAREIRRRTGRRLPDILAELSRAPRTMRRPSTDLVLLCSGLAHPIDGGRCARPAGHHLLDGTWSWCSPEPHLPARIWQGYHVEADVVGYSGSTTRPRALAVRLSDGRIALTQALKAPLAAQVAVHFAASGPPRSARIRAGETDLHHRRSRTGGRGPRRNDPARGGHRHPVADHVIRPEHAPDPAREHLLQCRPRILPRSRHAGAGSPTTAGPATCRSPGCPSTPRDDDAHVGTGLPLAGSAELGGAVAHPIDTRSIATATPAPISATRSPVAGPLALPGAALGRP